VYRHPVFAVLAATIERQFAAALGSSAGRVRKMLGRMSESARD
jgi:hypothetical protein